MKLGLIQIRVSNDPDDNLKQALESIEACAKAQADLVLMPELWNTPFDNASIHSHSSEWDFYIPRIQEAARKYGLWILAGTLPCQTTDPKTKEAVCYNRAALINDQGEMVTWADKLHLLEVHTQKHTYKEQDVFTPGDHLCTAKTPWGTIGICICYDIRFPELARLLCQDAFLLAVPAAFNDQVGPKHWKSVLETRAMENEVFAAGVNPAACSYPNYASYGHSLVVNPDGQTIAMMDSADPWMVVEIDPMQVQTIRRRQPFWQRRRTDLYNLEETTHEKDEL